MNSSTALPPIGFQASVLGKAYTLDDPSVLRFLADQGFVWLECGAKDPEAFRQLAATHGLRVLGGHTGCWDLQDPAPLIRKMQALGATHLCNSGLVDWHKRSPADYAQTIRVLNEAGRQCHEAGIALHYHNHDFEFLESVEGRRSFDVLLEGLDPRYVDLCIDIGWVTRAGVDLLPFLRQHAGRIGYIHCKDWDGQNWCELGQGKVDLRGFFALLPELPKVAAIMLEQDDTRLDPLESIRQSRSWVRCEIGV